MKTIHPDIAGRRFTTPQGSETCFEHFLEGFDRPRQELLAELSEGIAARHDQATPISSCSEEPAFLLELTRFIVVYQLLHSSVEVSTILCKRDRARPDHVDYLYPSQEPHPTSRFKNRAFLTRVTDDRVYGTFGRRQQHIVGIPARSIIRVDGSSTTAFTMVWNLWDKRLG